MINLCILGLVPVNDVHVHVHATMDGDRTYNAEILLTQQCDDHGFIRVDPTNYSFIIDMFNNLDLTHEDLINRILGNNER